MERFREDINRYRNKTGMPWAALAEKAGVSPAMFTRIKKGSAVTLEAFAQLCSSFQLNPIDYMPELQTKPTKEQPMEDVKRLSIDGKDFTIEDVELRSGPAWANGPRRADAELPDGRSSAASWHRTANGSGVSPERNGTIRNRPKAPSPNTSAMNRTASRPSEAYCRPSRTGIPPQRPTTHGHPCRTLTPPPCRMPSARPNRHRSGIPGLRPSQTRTPCPTRIQASTKAPCQPPDPGSECERRRTSCVTTRPERTRN